MSLADDVAREVMDWVMGVGFDQVHKWYKDGPDVADSPSIMECDEWDPEHRWDHTGMVLDRMQELGWFAYVWIATPDHDPGKAHCRFNPSSAIYGVAVDGSKEGPARMADEAPEAICHAALAAVRAGRGE